MSAVRSWLSKYLGSLILGLVISFVVLIWSEAVGLFLYIGYDTAPAWEFAKTTAVLSLVFSLPGVLYLETDQNLGGEYLGYGWAAGMVVSGFYAVFVGVGGRLAVAYYGFPQPLGPVSPYVLATVLAIICTLWAAFKTKLFEIKRAQKDSYTIASAKY